MSEDSNSPKVVRKRPQAEADRFRAEHAKYNEVPEGWGIVGSEAVEKFINTASAAKEAKATKAAKAAKDAIFTKSSILDHQVAPIDFLAGDFGRGTGHLLHSGKIKIPSRDQVFGMAAVESVEVITQETVKRGAKAWGWGLAGAAVFGPAGLVAGAVVGGNENRTTFAVTLANGQRFLAVAASGVYKHFLAATFA